VAWIEYVRRTPEARVLIVSQRRVAPMMSRCLLFNFEDVIASIDAVDIAAPLQPDGSRGWLRRNAARLDRLRLGAGRVVSHLDPEPGRRYRLLFVAVQGYRDLFTLGPLSAWLAAADVSVCYIEELWRSDLRGRRLELALLRPFDLVLLSCHGSVEPVAATTGRPTRYLAPGIDMPIFSPYPDPPPRCIDVYAMGRRSADLHRALLRLAAERGLFYLHDTSGDAPVHDPAEHRRHLAGLIKRARYFLASWAKFDVPGRTATQHEVGFRFFEGAAGGSVLLGGEPRTPMFAELFGWPDAVVPCGPDDVGAVIESLDRDPDRTDRIRRANVAHSLARHDCAYRWADVLAQIGLPPTPALEARRRQLAALAAAADPRATRLAAREGSRAGDAGGAPTGRTDGRPG
jgi:hypothetical protein